MAQRVVVDTGRCVVHRSAGSQRLGLDAGKRAKPDRSTSSSVDGQGTSRQYPAWWPTRPKQLPPPTPPGGDIERLAAVVFVLLFLVGLLSFITRLGWDSVLLMTLGLVLARPLWRCRPWASWAVAVVGPVLAVWFLVSVIQGADDDPGDASAYAGMAGALYLVFSLPLSVGLLHARYRASRPRSGWYSDPETGDRWRYWDGTGWSDDTSPK